MNYQINELIAHEAPMILVDRVVSCDDDSIMTAIHITSDTPFLQDDRVPSYVVIEYMAQSIAAYSGLQAKEAHKTVKIGFLLGTRKLELKTAHFQLGDEIIIEASPLYNDGEMASFDCSAKHEGQVVAIARLNVYQPNEVEEIGKHDG